MKVPYYIGRRGVRDTAVIACTLASFGMGHVTGFNQAASQVASACVRAIAGQPVMDNSEYFISGAIEFAKRDRSPFKPPRIRRDSENHYRPINRIA